MGVGAKVARRTGCVLAGRWFQVQVPESSSSEISIVQFIAEDAHPLSDVIKGALGNLKIPTELHDGSGLLRIALQECAASQTMWSGEHDHGTPTLWEGCLHGRMCESLDELASFVHLQGETVSPTDVYDYAFLVVELAASKELVDHSYSNAFADPEA